MLLGDAGRYLPDKPDQRDWLSKQIGNLPNVQRIAALKRKDVTLPAGIPMWSAPFDFEDGVVDKLLKWAGVQRPAQTTAEHNPGFQVQVRTAQPGKTYYVAAMRSWYGWYRANVGYEAKFRKRWGATAGNVTVFDLPVGQWRVHKLHRKPRDLGVLTTDANGSLAIHLDPALAGEVELFRIDRVESQ